MCKTLVNLKFTRLILYIILVSYRKQNYQLDINKCEIHATSCLLDVTSIDENVTKTVSYVT